MASRILPFRTPDARPAKRPPAPASARCIEPDATPGPRLAFARPAPRPAASQASRVSWRVEQEMIARVEGRIAERHAGRQAFLAGERRRPLPAQATTVGLRQRLFDALFAFAHA